jgi:dual specificity tyrosine-phosphorylation-regulated kinase 2/3/4
VTSKPGSLRSPISPKNLVQSRSPYSPKSQQSTFFKNLNDFEKEEVKDFKKVYYSGSLKHKVIPDVSVKNFGFDFDNGNYKLVTGDHLAYRYEIKNFIGKGSYGVVCECFDHKKKEPVAVKVLKNKKHFYQQGTIEISILKSIKDNDPDDQNCLIKLKFYFIFRKHICLVFPVLGMSLYDYIANNKYEGCSLKQTKEYTKQILTSLVTLSSLSIIHCDLKPENLLFSRNSFSQLKLIDFGSSCFFHEKVHSYIQSRFYRAPEIALGISYSSSIDIWSLGCIICEMFTGEVLFPADSESDLIALMIELLGTPPSHLVEKASKKFEFLADEEKGKVLVLKNGKEIRPKSKKIVSNDYLMLDLIFKCLDWDPEKRIKPEDAILHPWLNIRKKGKSISNAKNSPKALSKLKF